MLASLMTGGLAQAAPNGQPQPRQMNLPEPATTKMADIVWFHNGLLVLITAISIFVLVLLVYACWRFSAKRNPVPSKLTHHTGLEVAWTIIPVLILVVVAIPSFRILRDQLVIPPSDITLKVTGKQWYWSWEYPKDGGGFGFDSLMLDDKQRLELVNSGKAKAEEVPRLLGVDNEAVVPVGKIVRLQVTAADVIHKFALPAFGLKIDAIPGRLNETWFKAEKEGLYFGQCSFICGQNHAYMPIAIRVVSAERYAAWLAESQKKFARLDAAPTKVAAVIGQ
ncbi:MAG: cytochrome c oxidase subunit II [Beijerinckiaceae bacterium]|nr:cytochrome c oxidase subunit II [Beijerinckiaceae bacterium]